jgi:hypothetical protein
MKDDGLLAFSILHSQKQKKYQKPVLGDFIKEYHYCPVKLEKCIYMPVSPLLLTMIISIKIEIDHGLNLRIACIDEVI